MKPIVAPVPEAQSGGGRDSGRASRGGLEDVVAAETSLSYADPQRGIFILAGRDFRDLAGGWSYEDAVTLLWGEYVPGGCDADALSATRAAIYERLLPRSRHLQGLTPIEGQRCLLASLPDAEEAEEPVRMVAAVGVAAALAQRLSAGLGPIPPAAGLGHAADLLHMLGADAADPARVAGLESYLITMMDSALNASTFTARVAASTGAGFVSSVVAALSALKGPLHGGAPSLVLDMLDEVTNPDDAAAFVAGKIGRNARLPGFGSRAYLTEDPRAGHFKKVLLSLDDSAPRLAVAEAVERAALAAFAGRSMGRPVKTNLEFYAALLLEALHIPRAAFTSVFAAGRVAGWVAHVREQEVTGRLIRPGSRYVGPLPEGLAPAC